MTYDPNSRTTRLPDGRRISDADLARSKPMTDEQARRNRAAAEADELFSEGRKHRNILPNRKNP